MNSFQQKMKLKMAAQPMAGRESGTTTRQSSPGPIHRRAPPPRSRPTAVTACTRPGGRRRTGSEGRVQQHDAEPAVDQPERASSWKTGISSSSGGTASRTRLSVYTALRPGHCRKTRRRRAGGHHDAEGHRADADDHGVAHVGADARGCQAVREVLQAEARGRVEQALGVLQLGLEGGRQDEVEREQAEDGDGDQHEVIAIVRSCSRRAAPMRGW